MKKRVSFKMFLKPDCEKEYEKRHNELWPELQALLKNAGISDYTIYWDEDTNILFAHQTVSEGSGSQDLGTAEIIKKWWSFMADIMETNPDHSPISIPLKEVFHLD